LVLKSLLSQQNLDAPFTGGLGSYKLYVLVAYHIENTLEMGGRDRPGEILLGFLFRYACASPSICYGGRRVKSKSCTSRITQESKPRLKDGCEADLSNVFKVESLVELFGESWNRLTSRMREIEACSTKKKRCSILSPLVNIDRLQRDRENVKDKALAYFR
jgi:DNA polymerase sigma